MSFVINTNKWQYLCQKLFLSTYFQKTAGSKNINLIENQEVIIAILKVNIKQKKISSMDLSLKIAADYIRDYKQKAVLATKRKIAKENLEINKCSTFVKRLFFKIVAF